MTVDEQRRRPRVLVAHDSAHGSTAEVADEIGRVLATTGDEVVVRPASEVASIDGFDLVVVGSPIRFGRWMPGATEFVRAHRRQLATTPVAFFFTCLALSQSGPGSQRAADRYEQKIRAIAPEVVPLDVGGFAGALDYSRLPLPGRVVLGALLTVRGVGAGDHRDWSEIRAWAGDLPTSTRPAPDESGRERRRPVLSDGP